MPDGRAQRVDDATIAGRRAEDFRFDLSLASFADGGWYWFDIIAGPADAVLEEARLGRRRSRRPRRARAR